LTCLVLATQSIVNTIEPGWSTAGWTVKRDESVESYHDLSEAHFFSFWAKSFIVPRSTANLAGYWGNRLLRPETRDCLSIDVIEGIKNIPVDEANYDDDLPIC
jgi:hypothetical protein